MNRFFAQLRSLILWMRQAVTQPRDELDRWERALRFAYDLGRFGAMQLRYDRAPQMAAALAFRTLFSLLPVLVVSTVLVNAFKGETAFIEMLTNLFDDAGLYEITPGEEAAGEEGAIIAETTSLGTWLESLLTQASGMNLSAIGWVGLAVLLYSAIGLMVTIENSFNVIYRAAEGRNWLHRIPTYFTVLLGWPVAVALVMYVNAMFTAQIEAMNAWAWISHLAPLLWSFIAIWLLMTVIYLLVPNTSVELRPVTIGAFVASVLLVLGWSTMAAYLENALSIQHLYGSLGLIPVFMFWVYLMWLVILFGLEVAATLQKLGGRRLEEMRAQQHGTVGFHDPALALTAMVAIGTAFEDGRSLTGGALASELSIDEATARKITDALVEAGLLNRLARPEGACAPTRPLEGIAASDVLNAGFELANADEEAPAGTLTARLRASQLTVLEGVTVRSLVQKCDKLSGSHKEGH